MSDPEANKVEETEQEIVGEKDFSEGDAEAQKSEEAAEGDQADGESEGEKSE